MRNLNPWLDEFCGQTFWRLLGHGFPGGSKCFRQVILTGLPCLVLWALMPFEILVRLGSKARPIPWNCLNQGRIAIVVFCTALSIWEAINGLFGGHNSQSNLFVPLLKVVTFTSVACLLFYYRTRGVVTSGTLWSFNFIAFILSLLIFCYLFVDKTSFSTSDYITRLMYTPALFVLLIVNSFPDKLIKEESGVEDITKANPPSPQDSSSFPSRVTFWWFSNMAITGWNNDLTFSLFSGSFVTGKRPALS